MGESKIEWTDYTFNPWIGCQKVSEACKHCYAENETFVRVARSNGRELWGPNAERHITSESNWKQPLKWNRDAAAAGERRRVFCASLADVFEDRPELDEPRMRLLGLIEETAGLDWLLLTKRPENIIRLIERAQEQAGAAIGHHPWFLRRSNLWIGATVENQEQADKRIPELLNIPARVRFLSCEPLLGPIELYKWMKGDGHDNPWMEGIDWVIAGGESGPNARPAHPDWFRSLRDQCQAAGVAFHFKQHGEWANWEIAGLPKLDRSKFESHLFSERPYEDGEATVLHRVGKKAAGRILDGRTWDEFPNQEAS